MPQFNIESTEMLQFGTVESTGMPLLNTVDSTGMPCFDIVVQAMVYYQATY